MKFYKSEKGNRRLNILVITYSFSGVIGQAILEKLIDVIMPISKNIYVITGELSYKADKKIHIFKGSVPITIEEAFSVWIVKQIQMQLKFAYILMKLSRKCDIVIFILGGQILLLPLVIAKLLRKKVVVGARGSVSKAAKIEYTNKFFGMGIFFIAGLAKMLERSCFFLADIVTVQSPSVIHFLELNRYKNKIVVVNGRYVDIELFRVKKSINERQNVIGFIGHLNARKGVMNFAKAIPLVLNRCSNAEFLVGGNGKLLDDLKKELERNRCHEKVNFTSWIPHDKIPDYLNEIKLLVLPSSSEGVPGIVQEAMACGTPVLATPVGGIPDLIKDGETGFIVKDNSPECIAKNVLRVLEYPNLDEIVKNARMVIEKEHTYDVVVKRYGRMLESI